MIEKNDDEIKIYFLDQKIDNQLKKGIVALLILQIINIIYILAYKMQLGITDLIFSYIVIILMILRSIFKKKISTPNIILKDKRIILSDMEIKIEDVIEIKKYFSSVMLTYKVNDINNMIRLYSSDSKEKVEEIKSTIENYIKKYK